MRPVGALTSDLLAKLRGGGEDVEFSPGIDTLRIMTWGGERLQQPAVLVFSEDDLRQAVNISSSDRDALWPHLDIASAGMNLLLVHLEELIRTGAASHERILIGPDGLRSEGSEGMASEEPVDSSDSEWVTELPPDAATST